MRRFIATGGKRNNNAPVLTALIIGVTIVIFRRAAANGPIKSWTIAGHAFVHEGW